MSTIARSSLFTSTLAISFVVTSLSALASLGTAGCASDSDETSVSNDEMNAKPSIVAGVAEGETCSNGSFGTPVIECAKGLECDFGDGTAPSGPTGSSSAKTGRCAKPKSSDLLPCELEIAFVCPQGSFDGCAVAGLTRGHVCIADSSRNESTSCRLEVLRVCEDGFVDACTVTPAPSDKHVCTNI
jgi:hypothetical protein